MDGFLVVLRHAMDDLPLLLKEDRGEAMTAARKIGPKSGGRVKALLGLDSSTPNSVWLYHFGRGKLVAAEMVKEF